ncbi:DNA (cytosine-5-)-methyltransferase [cf. Phormidesmis sp. LEGE 11477]|nr:DNA (cytosine-5-)-methyltransferase [cf. Phormidesmis sp. LEGE 11477]
MVQHFTTHGLCAGAGGLDLGFELAGFKHHHSMDIEPLAVQTLKLNRPHWSISRADLRDYSIAASSTPDVLLAGVPCQGFSLGGKRQDSDPRNQLYKHVVRLARENQPRVVVIENVLNLRTMRCPKTELPFSQKIAEELKSVGYVVHHNIFKMCFHGVPQTRRRFVFVAFLHESPEGYHLPPPDQKTTAIREHLFDLANDKDRPINLPNHKPAWGFRSAVHTETGSPFSSEEVVVPVRFSRTASDGHPVRSFDSPFPAVDTATVWGWAQGNVVAERKRKDREKGKHIRNPNAEVTLWRIQASRLRSFTHREYARLQTFPDSWEFVGGNKRDIHKQIGNAVPVEFARRLGCNIMTALKCIDSKTAFPRKEGQLTLF